jgi:rhamnogalacturonyl hydrolase YesR
MNTQPITYSDVIDITSGEFSKSRLEALSNTFIEKMEEGIDDPMSILAQLEFLSQVIDKVKVRARQLTVDEIARYGDEAKQGVTLYGVTMRLKEAGVKYYFDHTELWNTIKGKEDAIAQQRKDLEAILKTISKQTSFINQETGEIHELAPARKSSTTTVEVTLKK